MNDPFTAADGVKKTDPYEPKRDRWGRYLLPPLTDAKGKETAYTRATTFAKSISDTFALGKWGERMAIKGLALRPDLFALTAATPLDDKDKLNQIAEDAKTAANAKGAANLGTALHAFTEAVDRGETPDVPQPWDQDVLAYQQLVQEAGLTFLPEHIERVVVVPQFEVAGTFDRIACLAKDLTAERPGREPIHLPAGTWVVDDTKTGRDLSYGWNEIAIQLALYAHAEGIWNGGEQRWEPMPPVDQRIGLVVHLPVGQAKATLYAVDIEAGWEAATLCEQVRAWRKRRALAGSVFIGGASPEQPAAPVAEPTYKDLIGAARSKADLSAVWKKATAAGEWTSELEQLGKQRQAELALV
jgi:hypothetical protein